MNDILDLKELVEGAPAPNTSAAYKKDMAYFWEWAKVSLNMAEAYPVSQEVFTIFVEQHVTGMQPDIDNALVNLGVKKETGRYMVSTVRRKISAIIKTHKMKGFNKENFRTSYIKDLLYAANKKQTQLGITTRRVTAITQRPLTRIIKTYKGELSLKDIRDMAIFMFGFYTGGRRGNEIINAKFKNLSIFPHGFRYNLASSKTDQLGKGSEKILRNPHSKYLEKWIKEAGIVDGYLFRGITPQGNVKTSKMNDKAIRLIVKERVQMIGYPPEDHSSHSLRRGFLTQCGIDGIQLNDAMQLSGHTSVATALLYYEAGQLERNKATMMKTKQR